MHRFHIARHSVVLRQCFQKAGRAIASGLLRIRVCIIQVQWTRRAPDTRLPVTHLVRKTLVRMENWLSSPFRNDDQPGRSQGLFIERKPQDLRKRASRCVALAETCLTQEARVVLSDLADELNREAGDLEALQVRAPLEHDADVRSRPHASSKGAPEDTRLGLQYSTQPPNSELLQRDSRR
jgi:hypothetical protein